MYIAINAQLLSFAATYRSGGISRYIYHLLANLARVQTPHRLAAFVPDLPAALEGWQNGRLQLYATGGLSRRPAGRILWEQLAQPALLRRSGVDLLHSTAYVSPLLWRGPSVLTVCDLSFIRYPEVFNRANRAYLGLLTRLSARRASRVLTISEHTRQDVVRLLGVPPERVATTYCGVDESFRPLDPDQVAAYRAQRGLPARYVLYLGTLEPRKNVLTLLRAFARLRSSKAIPHTLVLAGAPGWQYQGLYERVSALGIESDVRFLGFVPSAEQTLCYNAADLFVYPSLYEGFGLPVLEAMACGLPVVSSNAASLPEVVGRAGLQVAPLDAAALAEAMGQVLSDANLHNTLRRAGLDQARRFSWSSMAVQTLQVYDQALAGAPA
ncbi:MAG: glycosyltransferase family 4 protein [Chloroflexi bacterium]|nr:glycosyltransferase family 4 protein [Chloroflexota bacterium]